MRRIQQCVYTVGERKTYTQRNKLKQKDFFHSFITFFFFLAIIRKILKEHIYKEKMYKNIVFGHVPPPSRSLMHLCEQN